MTLEETRTSFDIYKRKPVMAKCIAVVDTLAKQTNGGCRYQFTPTVYFLQPRQKDKVPIWRLYKRLEPQWDYNNAYNMAVDYASEHDNILIFPEMRNNEQIHPAHCATLPFSVAKLSPRRFCILNTYPTFDALVSWLTLMTGFETPVTGAVGPQKTWSLWSSTGLTRDKPEHIEYRASCGCQRRARKKRFNEIAQDSLVILCSEHYKVFNQAETTEEDEQ